MASIRDDSYKYGRRVSSIEEFCSTSIASSLSELEKDEQSLENEFPSSINDDEDEDEMMFRPRQASVLSKESPVAHLRVPRLNIAILVCGTRGDVQPFVIIGQLLQSHGHRVRLATHDLYEDYVIDSGLEFYPLAGDPKKLSAHMVETGGRLLPLTAEEVKAVPEKQQMLEDIMRSTLFACTRAYHNPKLGKEALPFKATAIISNPVTYGHLHVAEYLDVPLHLMFPQPWSPTAAYPHPLSSIHDKRFYFSPTSPLKNKKQGSSGGGVNLGDESSAKKDSILSRLSSFKQTDSFQPTSSSLGGGGGGGSIKEQAEKDGQMSTKDFALYYDVRLTNRLSYSVADEFVWMGMRTMTNNFRVDLQTRLRVELKILSKSVLKKAGIYLNESSHSQTPHSASNSNLGFSSHEKGSTSLSLSLHGGASSHGNSSSSTSSSSRASGSGTSTKNSSELPWVGLEKIRAGESGANLIHDLKIPFAKMWSASLVPTPQDYGDHIDIIGNVFAPLADSYSYKPPEGLMEWLLKKNKEGEPNPPIFVGFGSMVIKDPAGLISTIEEAAKLSGRRVLLQSSWTDLSKSSQKKQDTKTAQPTAPTTESFADRATRKAQMLMNMMKTSDGKFDPSSVVSAVSSLGAAAAPTTSLGGDDDAADGINGTVSIENNISVEDDYFATKDKSQRKTDENKTNEQGKGVKEEIKMKVEGSLPKEKVVITTTRDYKDEAKESDEKTEGCKSSDISSDSGPLNSSGRKKALSEEDSLLFHIGSCPHEWLFPYVGAVVHHGGAGTVAAGLRAGKPTIVCPFFGDQHFWGVALERAKVGLNLGAVNKLTPQKLADGFSALTSPEMIMRAQDMAKAFEAEDGALNAVEAFYRHLPLDTMVCDVNLWHTPNSPSISKYLVYLGPPSLVPSTKNVNLNTHCTLHVSEDVLNAICRRFKDHSDDLDVPLQDKDLVDVEVPQGVAAGSSFTYQPRDSSLDPIKVLVPKHYRSGDKLRIKLPSTHKPPSSIFPELGEWQCLSCTSLNSPASMQSGCFCCQQPPPKGSDLIQACAGATGLRRKEGIEAKLNMGLKIDGTSSFMPSKKEEERKEKEEMIPNDGKMDEKDGNDNALKGLNNLALQDEEKKVDLKHGRQTGRIKGQAEVMSYDSEDEEGEEGRDGWLLDRQRGRAWSAVGMDLIDPTRDIAVYRGACAWIPPPPKDVASGIYQGTMGFVAQTSQAIGELVGGDLSGGKKFKRAFTTLATKPMLGFKGRVESRRQPRERLMGDTRYDETSALRLSTSEKIRSSQQLKKTDSKSSHVDISDDDDDESDIDDDHDDGDDNDMEKDGKKHHRQKHRSQSLLEVQQDEAIWRFFDAAAALCLCWGRHIGHDIRASETHRMALSEVMIELGYSASVAASIESDAQLQWDAGFLVTMQEVAVFLASKCGPPPKARAITMRHAAERHANSILKETKSPLFSFK